MRKKTLRIVAIVTCLAVLSLSVPQAATAKDKPGQFSFRVFVMKHLKFFRSLLPGMDAYDAPAPNNNKISKTNPTDHTQKVKKITGTVSSTKDPDDD